MGGGHTLVRPLGVWWQAPPENFLYSTLDFDLILGGGKLKLEGGNPSAPPPSVCNPGRTCWHQNAVLMQKLNNTLPYSA